MKLGSRMCTQCPCKSQQLVLKQEAFLALLLILFPSKCPKHKKGLEAEGRGMNIFKVLALSLQMLTHWGSPYSTE